MANPQLEDGYTSIAHEILDHLVQCHLSPNEWQVLFLIIRKTYGYHKKVDYIANSQIVEATGLCKAVVSRMLHQLATKQFITRNKKHIGFQKDWELWGKLAEQSTLSTKLAEQLTSEKLAIQSTELAIQSTELAEQSTKVSSPRVTQKIKDTITKDTIQKIGDDGRKQTLEDYAEGLRLQFTDINFDNELKKFHLYWSEGNRKLKRPKLALFNWMEKAREIKRDKVEKDDPDKYIKGQYGHMVQR